MFLSAMMQMLMMQGNRMRNFMGGYNQN